MKVGLIARSEDRGLGNLTWEWAEHMRPDRVLVVEPNHRIPQRRERFPGALFVRWNHRLDSALDERIMRRWLAGLDVVYSAETFYDWRICDWARELGVRTVCHAMPEYYAHGRPDPPPAPDVWWTPTRWRLEFLPPATRVVPVPIAVERFALHDSGIVNTDPLRWLHVAGARAAGDRNGSEILTRAMLQLREPARVRIRTLDGVRIPGRLPSHVEVEIVRTPAAEYWELYGDADVHVLPRRYAGLSLPALESMAAGLALMMPDAEPQRSEWPALLVSASMRGRVKAAGGLISTSVVVPSDLASSMDDLARHRSRLVDAQHRAARFACSQSWAVLEPTIRRELDLACG